jgi:hypothetical protein
MRSIVLAMAFLCVLFSPAEARRGHGRLPWCGIYMNQYFGKSDRSLWVARNWAREGANAGGPSVGVVVVWPHHVGVITGQAPNGEWIVHSGNDGGAVRTRPRSLRGVIAYRSIGGAGLTYADLKGQEQAVAGRHKHLVALAVEGGHQPNVVVPLKKSRPVAVVASVFPMSTGIDAAAFASPTERADKARTKKRQSVTQRERMFVPLFAPVPETVHTLHRKQTSIHASPYTQLDQVRADRPSSRASLRSEARRHRASQSWGNAGHGHAAGGGGDWRAFQQAPI